MEKFSVTFISDLFLNSLWFLIYAARDIFADIKKILIVVLGLITAVCIAVSVWAVAFRVKEPEIIYNFVKAEQNAVEIAEEPTHSVYCADGEPARIIYDYSIYADTVSGKVYMLFGLPSNFAYDAVVSYKSLGQEFAKSGRITAGNKISELEILLDFDSMYLFYEPEAEMVVDFYDRKTGEMLEKRINTGVTMTSNMEEFL